MAIDENRYREYLSHLLRGDLQHSRDMVQRLLEQGVAIQAIYIDLLQRGLYEVDELWAANRISVGIEHLATAQTEDLMRMVYPLVARAARAGRKAIISCTADEYHQVGGRMVADLMELDGWEVAFMGANTPVKDLEALVGQLKPDLVGLSATIPANLPRLLDAVQLIRRHHPSIPVIVGGQAFRLASQAPALDLCGARYVQTVDQIDSAQRAL